MTRATYILWTTINSDKYDATSIILIIRIVYALALQKHSSGQTTLCSQIFQLTEVVTNLGMSEKIIWPY